MEQKIGIFGGTFNPPHLGHLYFAKRAFAELGLTHMLIVPAGIPPHKDAKDRLPFAHRCEMARLAFKGLPHFEVSDMEGKRAGPSYTVDTLRAVSAEHPNAGLYLFIGADMLISFESWKDFNEILKLSTVVVSHRKDVDRQAAAEKSEELTRRYGARIILMGLEPVKIHSTQIRRMIREGKDVSQWLSPEVLRYIAQNNLYGDPCTPLKGTEQ